MNRIAQAITQIVAPTAAALAASVVLMTAGPAHAQSADQVKAEFARSVYLSSATQVHNEQPQALLRAVVVLRVKLDEQGQWRAEVFRENPDQPELTKAALESVARLPAPTGLSPKALSQLHGEGVVEAWLFQTDGRFALKSVAKPQKRA